MTWQTTLLNQPLAPATVNNHLASLSAFTTWVHSQQSKLFDPGNPSKGLSEPHALSLEQVRSLKSLCDRLERFHQLKGQPRQFSEPATMRLHTYGRPWRDRAIIT